MRVELHIEHLVLHGFPDGDGPALAAALRERLGTLLATTPVAWASAGRVDAGQVDVSAAASPAETGARLAEAVHRGLEGRRRRDHSSAAPPEAHVPGSLEGRRRRDHSSAAPPEAHVPGLLSGGTPERTSR